MQAGQFLASACTFKDKMQELDFLKSIYKSIRKMTNNEFVKSNARVNTLVEKLRRKLKNFSVMDKQGELVGEVKDLILDNNRQLNLVVSEMANVPRSRLFLLMSKLIQKIDTPNKSVCVDINKAEIEHLPEYLTTETLGMEVSEMQNNPVTPAQEAENEGTIKDSEYQSAAIMPTPSFESGDSQDGLDKGSALYSDTPDLLEEEVIRLLGERLVVDRGKRRVGEVIVRKEIETLMVQVPVRREKLIVEQVSPEHKQLAEINLGQGEISGIELTEEDVTGISLPETASIDGELTVRGEFKSPKIASLLLNAIALERRHGCKKVRLEIVVEDAERQKTYQEWFERSSGSQAPSAQGSLGA